MTKNNEIVAITIFLAGIVTGGLLVGNLEQRVVKDTVTLVTNAEKIDSYNAGFRAGSMDILSQLVECEGLNSNVILQYYQTASDTLARLGELDSTPYPCYE